MAQPASAITIEIDYRFDSNGFFSDPLRRERIEAAALDLAGRLSDNLTALSASGANSWTARFANPGEGLREGF